MTEYEDAFATFRFKPGDVVCLNGDTRGVVRLTVAGQVILRTGEGQYERGYRCSACIRGAGGEPHMPHGRMDYVEAELMAAPPVVTDAEMIDASAAMRDTLDRLMRSAKRPEGGGA